MLEETWKRPIPWVPPEEMTALVLTTLGRGEGRTTFRALLFSADNQIPEPDVDGPFRGNGFAGAALRPPNTTNKQDEFKSALSMTMPDA